MLVAVRQSSTEGRSRWAPACPPARAGAMGAPALTHGPFRLQTREVRSLNQGDGKSEEGEAPPFRRLAHQSRDTAQQNVIRISRLCAKKL